MAGALRGFAQDASPMVGFSHEEIYVETVGAEVTAAVSWLVLDQAELTSSEVLPYHLLGARKWHRAWNRQNIQPCLD